MDKLKELHDSIQCYEVESPAGSPAYRDALAILNLMDKLVDELRRIEAANVKCFQDNTRE